MVKCPDEKDNICTDKAAERLRQFEDARVPQELFNDPEIKANQSINEVPSGKKEDTEGTADSFRQQGNSLSGNKQK